VRGVRPRRRQPAVLQRRGRGGPARRAAQPGKPPDSHCPPGGQPAARGAAAVRRRLPDPGRHLRPRLHPRRGPGHRPPARPGGDPAGQARDLQPRQRRRLQQQAGHRRGPRGDRPPGPGQAGAPARRRRRRHGRRRRQGAPRAWLAPGQARPARDHRRRLVLPPPRLIRARCGGRAWPPSPAWPAARRGSPGWRRGRTRTRTGWTAPARAAA